MTKPLLIALLSLALGLQSQLLAQFGKPKTQAAIIPEFTSVTPGQTFTIALELTHDKGWHSYFINDGIGHSIIPEVEWKLPQSWSAGDLQFPAPHEFSFAGAQVYGYEGTNYFLTSITVPENAPDGPVELVADSSWQVCDDSSCLPPNGKELTFSLTIADTSVKNAEYNKVGQYKLEHFPSKELPVNLQVSAQENDEWITLAITGDLPKGTLFFEYDKQIDLQSPRHKEHIDGTTHFKGKRNQGNKLGGEAGPELENLRGILYSPNTFKGSEHKAFWIDVPFGEISSATTPTVSAESQPVKQLDEPGSDMGVPVVLGSLLLGGLILNLMPCVFPVIGLKIMGFVQQAGEDSAKIKLHGLAFTAGVLLSFLALAAALYPLKATTTLGAQLQEPWVVFILMIVMLLLALSMAGLFEIGARATSVGGKLTQKEGVSGSFFSGVLAVVIATPCSAPFLGPAIGAAWNFEGPLFFLALLMMGIGLALPYITLSFFPSLVNKLPRPGAWMESFKQGMSFLLFATVGYLIWIYNGQIGDVGQKGLAIMLGATLIALSAWIYGRWNTPAKKKQTQLTAKVLALLTLLAGFWMAMPPKAEDPEVAAAEAAVPELDWQKWTPELEAELRAAGTPVFVDFTAKWCLTCQTNKAAAYTAATRKFFHDNGIVTLKADMTKKNPQATQAIHALDRSAIPVNVLYAPNDENPHVTREVLTPDYLTDFIGSRLDK
ncbi:protein-disulfide reductase DsbD family protein [Rubritalea spongiae]|uniref:Protein-disulfide reductase DsbD family protein n=1 Tax=Rubritalea spongiae TaxID=430797 RepID=A0ABW5E3M2_9BACT